MQAGSERTRRRDCISKGMTQQVGADSQVVRGSAERDEIQVN